jgi:hypothetical protein
MLGLESVPPQTILLAVGLVLIIIVLMFAMSMGLSTKSYKMAEYQEEKKCTPEAPKPVPRNVVFRKSSYRLSNLLPPGPCPTGYTNFIGNEGNTLCCATTNIDPYSHICSAGGSEGVCSMTPGIEDNRGDSSDIKHYPVCQVISKQQQDAKSGRFCPRRFPNWVSIPNTNGLYKCCGGPLSPGGVDCISNKLCKGLAHGQSVFNTPDSCETVRLLESISCPKTTNLIKDMKGTSGRTNGLSMPICIGPKGNCFPRGVLQKFRDLGMFTDIDLDKNILNCEIYNKVYNDRLWIESQAETTKSADLD